MILSRIIAGAALLALAGCAAVPPERHIRLDAPPGPVAPATNRLNGDLQVLSFQARGLLGERRLAYVDAATGELRQAASLIWEEPPPRALELLTARFLRAAGIAGVVYMADQRGEADYTLAGRVERFELLTRPGTSGTAVVEIEFTLLDGKRRRPISAITLCDAEPIGADGAAAPAFSLAAARVMQQLASVIGARGAAFPASHSPRGAACSAG